MIIEAKPEVILEHWYIVDYGAAGKCLHGQFFHHYNQNNCPDGSWGQTSRIVDTDNNTWAETRNTMYSLGVKAQSTKH